MSSLNESIVEEAALEWFGDLGNAVGHGPQLAPPACRDDDGAGRGEPAAERAGWEWLATKGSAKSSEYAAGMKVDERTARRHLNQFLKLGLARKSGAGPSTDYTIKQ